MPPFDASGIVQASRRSLKILLMQIREDRVTQEEELQEFMRYGQLKRDQFQILDVFQTQQFDASILQGCDALFIGGSSDASVLNPERFPFVFSGQALLRYAVDHRFPVFASCFGFQLLICALGGTVIHDHPNLEMGVYPLSLTPAGREDPLLQDLPNPFLAISGHKERASNLPHQLIHLAYSERAPIYGFQFHPEVDAQDLKARLIRYQTRYLEDTSQTQKIIDSLQDTHHANQLISNFVDRILLSSEVCPPR